MNEPLRKVTKYFWGLVNEPLRKVTKYFWRYVWEFRWVFFTVLFGFVVLAISLRMCEPRVGRAIATHPVLLSEEVSAPPATDHDKKSGGKELALPTRPSTTDMHGQLQEILQQLREISYALAHMNQGVSSEFGAEAARIKALDDRLQSLLSYWKQLDDSRRVDTVNSFYYTWIAMLGLGDFGAQTLSGKIIVALAGLWGVLAFGMLTALLVAAVKRYYNDNE